MMPKVAACFVGFVMDFLFGDPDWIYHPVQWMGRGISYGEKVLRKFFRKERNSLIVAGTILWICIAALSYILPFCLLLLADRVHPALSFCLESFWCWQIFAARGLVKESKKVYEQLAISNLDGARNAVSMIVGRDTKELTTEGVIKATVETIAENTSDGVTAPLLYMILGGAPLGFLYKAVNTMDSMLGYKNEKYIYFGRVPAKLDDVFNYLPSRITAWFMIISAGFLGFSIKGAWKIYRRDRRKHASPNSAQTESVCAGALGVQLAGNATYFGKLYEKEFIGENLRPIENEDIVRAGRLMYSTSVLMLIFFGVLKVFLVL